MLAGIFASLAALMFNCVRKEDIDYSPYEEGEWRLAALFLFIAVFVFFQFEVNNLSLELESVIATLADRVFRCRIGQWFQVF